MCGLDESAPMVLKTSASWVAEKELANSSAQLIYRSAIANRPMIEHVLSAPFEQRNKSGFRTWQMQTMGVMWPFLMVGETLAEYSELLVVTGDGWVGDHHPLGACQKGSKKAESEHQWREWKIVLRQNTRFNGYYTLT